MAPAEIVMRAWKDEEFFSSLSAEQQAAIPPRPDNFEALTDEQLAEAAGGTQDFVEGVGNFVGTAVRWIDEHPQYFEDPGAIPGD